MLEILFPSLKEGKNCKTFLASWLPQICNIFPILPNTQHFPNRWSMQVFLTSGRGPDILIKVFEGYIILLILAGWLLFNFYLKQKQRFSVWSFTEIISTISFHEEISSITKNTKKFKFQRGNFKYNKNKKQKLNQNLLTQ